MKQFLDKVDRRILTSDEIKMMNGSKLAFIGDAVYEVYIRTYVMNNYRGNVNQLNKKGVSFVKASAQAEILEYLKPYLTDEEMAVVTRGRNVKTNTPAKNASIKDYKLATGFEALIGMLHLKGEKERIEELIVHGIRHLDKETYNG
ncbi:MAG: Mini-ribonuclease 3 [Clostridia bacterium]|nr:Mini-ribonuclease 3 [Clostridia bacterium]